LHHHISSSAGSDAAAFVNGDAVLETNEWFINIADPAPAIARMTANWNVKFDSLDLSLSRPFYQGQRLTVTPFTGLFGVFVRQQFDINAYLAETPAAAPDYSNNSSRGWGVGPEVGSNFNWLLGNGFRIE